jgi:pimeloyl-ACP methyl ester carboxylesterase
MPKSFTPEELRSIRIPVLLLLGKRDALLGNPLKAEILANNFPNVRIKVLDTGHLISAEKPKLFNKLITEFIQNITPINQTENMPGHVSAD